MKTTVEKLKEQSINIKDICDSFAINYKVATNRDLLIKSPANTQQKTESLRVRADYKGSYNYFKDFANDEIGDILNFTKYMFNVNTAEASKLLKNKFLLNINTAEMQVKKREQIQSETVQQSKKETEILEVSEIKHKALQNYITNERKISLDVAKKASIKEIRYKNEKGTFFALAYENNSKGFETRNAKFKGAVGKKDITVKNGESNKINVFEGFIDYASGIVLSNETILNDTNIILNSTSLTSKAITFIKDEMQSKSIREIKLYLDNDKSGKEAIEVFKNNFDVAIDMTKYYTSDLNEHLQNKMKSAERNLDYQYEQ